MNFLIIGAGGIGAFYAARLINAGHKVKLVARGQHLAAMQKSELKIHHPELQFNQPVAAFDGTSIQKKYKASDFDLILLTLKATQTKEFLAAFGSWLALADTPVLSLQNGVDNERLIAEVIGNERVAGGLAVRIGGHIVAPGVIDATGPAQVVLGAWPQSLNHPLHQTLIKVTEIFKAARIPTRLAEDIEKELWLKLIINNGVNPLSTLTQLDTRALTTHPVYRDTVYKIMQETAAAAAVDGIKIAPIETDGMFNLICEFDAIKTSMLVDREKGKPLELDAISGPVIARGNKVPGGTPLTTLIASLLRADLKKDA